MAMHLWNAAALVSFQTEFGHLSFGHIGWLHQLNRLRRCCFGAPYVSDLDQPCGVMPVLGSSMVDDSASSTAYRNDIMDDHATLKGSLWTAVASNILKRPVIQ